MSDVNLIDIDALNNLKDEFEKQIKEISSSTLNTFQNSYLTQSNDLYVKQMANRIKKGLEGISTSGNNISSWLTNYLNDVQGLDKALSTDQKSAPISSSSVLSYLKTLPFLGEIDLSKLSFNSINSKKEISSINNNTNSNGNITGKTSLNSSSKAKEEVKETLTSVQNKQQEVIDINKIKNISQEAIAEIGQAFTEFVITSDENLPKAAEGLTNMMKNAGLLTASSAKVVNDTVTAYVSEGVKASIQGAATFAANFDYQKVAQGYTQATTVLAEEGSKGAQAGLQAGLSNFNAEPIVQSGVTAFNQISSAVSAGNTDVSTYLNPMANVATETLNQTIPAVQAGATEFAKNFNAEKVVNGYVNATINAAEITSRAASLGINSSLSSVDVNRLDDANKRAMDTLGLACAETYANFMDGFKETIDSLDWQTIPTIPIPTPTPGGNTPSIPIPSISDLPNISDIDLGQIANIPLGGLPSSGYKTVGDYISSLKQCISIDNNNLITALPQFIFAARNTVQMGMYAPQIAYDKGAQIFNEGYNVILKAVNQQKGYGETDPNKIKTITSIGDSCESGWGLTDYNKRGKYIVANENVKGSAPMLVGQALGAKVNQLHMPGARTSEVLQILNPLYSGDYLTNPVMGAMTPQYTSNSLESYRDKYYDAIKNSDVIVLDIGMNDLWVPIMGTFYDIATEGGATSTDLMADMADNPLGWMFQFAMNYCWAWLSHGPDKWVEYSLMMGSGVLKWLVDYPINYVAIVYTIYSINPNAELVLVGGYNPVDDWDIIPGMDDNIPQYALQVFYDGRDMLKRILCLLYPGKATYVDMRGVEIQSDETTFLLPSLDSDGYNPHPTQKGAYQQADKILTSLNKESPYKEQIKGDEGYYNSEEDFYKVSNYHIPRKWVGGSTGETLNTVLDAVPQSQKQVTNMMKLS